MACIHFLFIHRRLGKWGWFEKILVTPTHHGIHHASNPEYLDKNYGDVLIIWDKMFGTFAKEKKDVEIEYGLTKQLKSHSFLMAAFSFSAGDIYEFQICKRVESKMEEYCLENQMTLTHVTVDS